jgi:hypothetical protein
MIYLYPGDYCEGAKVYYYDYLGGEGIAEVPERIQKHVKHCAHCLGQIGRLAEMLAGSAHTKPDRDALTTQLLTLHFSHLGQTVTCAAVKPFLPTLADPTLSIRVTTPITQHLGRCAACRRDLESLASLELTGAQLYRLGQFLADPALNTDMPVVSAWGDCVADLRAGQLTAAQCKQVCLSPRGRDRIRTQRSIRISGLAALAASQPNGFCEHVTAADLFAYALPYGGTLLKNESAPTDDTVADHVRACSRCLGRLQSLQETFFALADRENSEVVTVMTVDEPARRSGRAAQSAAPGRAEDRTPPRRITPVLRAAAAVLVIVAGLAAFMLSPPATAVEYQQMQNALMRVPAIHITKVQASDGTVVEEIWGLPGQGQWLIRQQGAVVFWDVPNAQRRYRDKSHGEPTTQTIPAAVLADLKASQAGLFGVLPETGRFPDRARWEPAHAGDAAGETYIRKLVIPQRMPDGRASLRTRIYHLDTTRHLPHTLEYHGPKVEGTGLEKKTVTSVRYPAELDLRLQAEALGLRMAGQD